MRYEVPATFLRSIYHPYFCRLLIILTPAIFQFRLLINQWAKEIYTLSFSRGWSPSTVSDLHSLRINLPRFCGCEVEKWNTSTSVTYLFSNTNLLLCLYNGFNNCWASGRLLVKLIVIVHVERQVFWKRSTFKSQCRNPFVTSRVLDGTFALVGPYYGTRLGSQRLSQSSASADKWTRFVARTIRRNGQCIVARS